MVNSCQRYPTINLPLEVQQCVRAGLMGVACGRILLELERGADQLKLVRRCIAEKMSAGELARAVRGAGPNIIEQLYHLATYNLGEGHGRDSYY